jgi:hypothetical protein
MALGGAETVASEAADTGGSLCPDCGHYPPDARGTISGDLSNHGTTIATAHKAFHYTACELIHFAQF